MDYADNLQGDRLHFRVRPGLSTYPSGLTTQANDYEAGGVSESSRTGVRTGRSTASIHRNRLQNGSEKADFATLPQKACSQERRRASFSRSAYPWGLKVLESTSPRGTSLGAHIWSRTTPRLPRPSRARAYRGTPKPTVLSGSRTLTTPSRRQAQQVLPPRRS